MAMTPISIAVWIMDGYYLQLHSNRGQKQRVIFVNAIFTCMHYANMNIIGKCGNKLKGNIPLEMREGFIFYMYILVDFLKIPY